jgi:hypothetical protein
VAIRIEVHILIALLRYMNMCYDSRFCYQHEHTLVPVLTGALDAASEDSGEQRAAPSRRAVIRSVS